MDKRHVVTLLLIGFVVTAARAPIPPWDGPLDPVCEENKEGEIRIFGPIIRPDVVKEPQKTLMDRIKEGYKQNSSVPGRYTILYRSVPLAWRTVSEGTPIPPFFPQWRWRLDLDKRPVRYRLEEPWEKWVWEPTGDWYYDGDIVEETVSVWVLVQTPDGRRRGLLLGRWVRVNQ